jgi:hypothetical protein
MNTTKGAAAQVNCINAYILAAEALLRFVLLIVRIANVEIGIYLTVCFSFDPRFVSAPF